MPLGHTIGRRIGRTIWRPRGRAIQQGEIMFVDCLDLGSRVVVDQGIDNAPFVTPKGRRDPELSFKLSETFGYLKVSHRMDTLLCDDWFIFANGKVGTRR